MFVEPTHAVAVTHDAIRRPSGHSRWFQEWRDVLFIHWRVPPESLLPHLPPGLALDLWKGEAWVSAVAFRLKVRLRGFPAIWPVSTLLELNLRTYVRCGRGPGIFFLGMHADNLLAIVFARCLTPLPYAVAQITYTGQRRRRFRTSTPAQLLLDAEFEPRGNCRGAAAHSLDAWLLERYRAFVPDRRGRLCRMTVEHPRWQVQDTALAVSAPALSKPWEIKLHPTPDFSHYSPGLAAQLWPFEPLE